MNKIISMLLRKIGLIKFADTIRFYIMFIKTYSTRREFKKSNPNIILPPPFYLYETFNLNYNSYYNKSIDTAEWLVSHFKKYQTLDNIDVLDWGCGPGRVIRHLPNFMGNSCRFFGTDYNKKYVKWCSKNIQNVSFSLNQLSPPLQFQNNSFDIIYGISIFTHLSREMHFAWFNELMRVLKPNGILFVTLHGNAFFEKLTEDEKKIFKKGDLVIKTSTKEGHRTYGAFQPISFVMEMIGSQELLEHVEGKVIKGKPEQDIWIIKKTQ